VKILVTGGAGFIGSHVVDGFLAAAHEVGVVDDLSTGKRANLNSKATFYNVDIRSPEIADILAKEKPDVVCHHAAQMDVRRAVREPQFDASVNVVGSVNVLESARQRGVKKIIYASTGGAVYGEPASLPVDEGHAIAPLSPYGLTKHTFEEYLALYRRLYGCAYTVLRYPNVFGPRQDPHGEAGVVSIFAEAMLSGRPPTIFGDGRQTRDFVFVTDVADAVVRGAEAGNGKLLNIGTGVETSVNQIAALLVELTGSKVRPGYGPDRPGDVRRSVVDPSAAAVHLGWQASTPLREGLRRTVDYFR